MVQNILLESILGKVILTELYLGIGMYSYILEKK